MTTAASGGGVANTRNHSRGRIAAVNKQTDGANYSGESCRACAVEDIGFQCNVVTRLFRCLADAEGG